MPRSIFMLPVLGMLLALALFTSPSTARADARLNINHNGSVFNGPYQRTLLEITSIESGEALWIGGTTRRRLRFPKNLLLKGDFHPSDHLELTIWSLKSFAPANVGIGMPDEADPLIVFFKGDVEIGRINAGDQLLKGLKPGGRTVSHYRWNQDFYVDWENKLILITEVDGAQKFKVAFEIVDGKAKFKLKEIEKLKTVTPPVSQLPTQDMVKAWNDYGKAAMDLQIWYATESKKLNERAPNLSDKELNLEMEKLTAQYNRKALALQASMPAMPGAGGTEAPPIAPHPPQDPTLQHTHNPPQDPPKEPTVEPVSAAALHVPFETPMVFSLLSIPGAFQKIERRILSSKEVVFEFPEPAVNRRDFKGTPKPVVRPMPPNLRVTIEANDKEEIKATYLPNKFGLKYLVQEHKVLIVMPKAKKLVTIEARGLKLPASTEIELLKHIGSTMQVDSNASATLDQDGSQNQSQGSDRGVAGDELYGALHVPFEPPVSFRTPKFKNFLETPERRILSSTEVTFTYRRRQERKIISEVDANIRVTLSPIPKSLNANAFPATNPHGFHYKLGSNRVEFMSKPENKITIDFQNLDLDKTEGQSMADMIVASFHRDS